MEHPETGQSYNYSIDNHDIIVAVSENWRSFAEENCGIPACLPEKIIGSSLWGHIADWETRQLYELILKRVQNTKHQATFPFRCDSPAKRRFLTLTIIPTPRGLVDFKSKIVKTESREPVELLNSEIEKTDELLRICSMCKKVAISKTEWVEVEIAVQQLGLFQKKVMPQFTHGVCPPCFAAAMVELDALDNI